MSIIIGLIVGSFISSLAKRISHQKPLFWDRSRCMNCRKKLKAIDLIPVLSFFFLRGRCRYCRKSIGFLYPFVEILTPTLYYCLRKSILDVIFITIILLIVAVDIDTMLIPVAPLCLISILSFIKILNNNITLIDSIAGAVSVASIFLLIHYATGSIGYGDVELVFFVGTYLGFKNMIISFFLSTFVGSIIGFFLLSTKKATRKTSIPYAPLLLPGILLTLI